MAGVYIHIPFCVKQCSYCDFHFSTTYAPYRERMLKALEKELLLRSGQYTGKVLETIYFGGGTPSLLSGGEIGKLLQAIERSYATANEKEITLECNPDDCSDENLRAWREAGVNRLSIGIQSFTDHQLDWMNRTHTAHEGAGAVRRAAKAGFRSLTVDLMYGLPGLTGEEWKAQLDRVIALDVDHISAYCLTIEEKTPLAKWVKGGKIHPPDADQQSEQFEQLVETLAQAGYEQYEISNFARSQGYSKHNTAYWKGKSYIGIGPSAHGFNGTQRYWNVAGNHKYMQAIESGTLPETVETLSDHDRFNELLLVGLRTKWGVEKQKLFDVIQPGDQWFRRAAQYKSTGKLVESETHYILTLEGRLLADAIASDLFLLS